MTSISNHATIHDIEEVLYGLSEEHGIDWNIKVGTAYECMWSATVLIVDEPNKSGSPDAGFTSFSVGAPGPVEAIRRSAQHAVPAFLERVKQKG